MAYLVQITNDSPTYNYIGKDQVGDFTYIRVMHNEIMGPTDKWVRDRLQELISESKLGAAEKAAFANFGRQTSSSGNRNVDDSGESGPSALANFMRSAGNNSQNFRGNPIIRSFESAGGRGLAGFMTEISFDQSEMPWETAMGSRAPIALKVSITFKPIHDIPMGLDSDGMMRSVAYGVGSISNNVNGDVYETGQELSTLHTGENSAGVRSPTPPRRKRTTGTE